MIYKAKTTNKTIKALKAKLGLTGDVYVINEHIMESLESHKRMFPESEVSTIEEAEAERLAKIEQERLELEELAKLHENDITEEE